MSSAQTPVAASEDGRRTLTPVAVSAGSVEMVEHIDGREVRRLWPSIESMRDAALGHQDGHPYRALWGQIERLVAERDEAAERTRLSAAIQRMQACPGHRAVRESEAWGYTHGVAVHPYTEENRRAHGAIGVTETCACGATRSRLQNQGSSEYSPWRVS